MFQNSVSDGVSEKKKKGEILFFWTLKDLFSLSSSNITCIVGSDGYKDFEMP